MGENSRFKRDCWRTRSLGPRPRPIQEENIMRPDRTHKYKPRGKKLFDVLRLRPERRLDEEIPTKDVSNINPALRQSLSPRRVRPEEERWTTLVQVHSEELFETQSERGGGLKRSNSYVVVSEEDPGNEMTSPVIIDVGDMKVELEVGEKPGTMTLGTQTEQVPAGLSAETSLELLKKLSITALRRELARKKVRFSKNDGKDQLQGKLQAVLQMEACPPNCPLSKGKVTIHSEPGEIRKKAQQIAAMAHQTDTPQVLSEASMQLSQVTQQVRVIRQLIEAHVQHIKAITDHCTTECGCNVMLENLCHSLSHYHVRKLESQLQETMSEIQMLQLEKHSLLRVVSRLCNKRSATTPFPPRPASAMLGNRAASPGACMPCSHGDCRIDYLTNLMTTVLQHNHNN